MYGQITVLLKQKNFVVVRLTINLNALIVRAWFGKRVM